MGFLREYCFERSSSEHAVTGEEELVISCHSDEANSGEYKQQCQARTGQTGNTALLYQRHQVPSISATCATGLAQKLLVASRVTRKGDRRREEGEKQRGEKRSERRREASGETVWCSLTGIDGRPCGLYALT